MSYRISVIIPCFRDAATIGRALDSVYAQTRRVDEVVVVNDCSPETDVIETVLSKYPHIVYIKNAINLGLAATRNAGLRLATGDIVSFLDADDELHPQKIELQLGIFTPDSAISCRVCRTDTNDEIVKAKKYSDDFRVIEFGNSKEIILRNRLTGASIMIDRELLLRFGGYDDSLRSCEDFDLWLRLLEAGVVVRDIQLPLYVYRMNSSGLSRNYPHISYWELEALKKYFMRNGRVFLGSCEDALIWSFWLIKHIYRYEKSHDQSLCIATRENISLLDAHPWLKGILNLVQRLRLMKLFALIENFRLRNIANYFGIK